MKVLHIARFLDNPCSGVSVAVPKHVLSQQKYAEVALVNLENYFVPGINYQFEFSSDFSVSALPTPFSKPDIVIFHEVYYLPFIKIANELKKLKIPYIVIPHGCMTQSAQRKKFIKKKLGNAVFFHSFVKNAAAVQYLSDKERDTSKFRKCFVIPNGIALPEAKKTYSTPECLSQIKLLFIGRMDPFHKGLDLLVSAAASVAGSLRENGVRLLLYGPEDNNYHNVLSRIIREHGVDDIFVLHREIFGSDKIQAILDADFFIQTSRFEGMPMGVLEALSYGLPCLLTEGTCIGERVEKAGAGLSCPTSSEGIAEMLIKAIAEIKNRKTYSKNAITFIKNEYELDAVARKSLKEYALHTFSKDKNPENI